MKPVSKIEEVKHIYALTDEQANILREMMKPKAQGRGYSR